MKTLLNNYFVEKQKL